MSPIKILHLRYWSTECNTIQPFTLIQKVTHGTVFLQKISHLPTRPFIESPHAKVFSNGMTIILHKMGSVYPLSLPKQFRHCKALIK